MENCKLENYKLLKFKAMGDERGFLTPLEGNGDIPFEIKRVFYIYGTKDEYTIRGQHANRYSQFVLIMLTGSCKIDIFDTDGSYKTFELNDPNKGIYVEKMIYKKLYNFTKDAVLLCITDKHFNSEEYIDNYEEFLKEIRKEKV